MNNPMFDYCEEPHWRALEPVHHKILLIEDDESSEFLIECTLKSFDKEVELKWVKSAEEAERLLKEDSHYDLIIVDHFLQGKETGIEFWKNCQNSENKTPFLITSSLSPGDFLNLTEERLEHPFFLHKPFALKECRNIIREVLEHPSVKPTHRPVHTAELTLSHLQTDVPMTGEAAQKLAILSMLATFVMFLFYAQVEIRNSSVPVNRSGHNETVSSNPLLDDYNFDIPFVVIRPGLSEGKFISERRSATGTQQQIGTQETDPQRENLVSDILATELKENDKGIIEFKFKDNSLKIDISKFQNRLYQHNDGAFDEAFSKYLHLQKTA